MIMADKCINAFRELPYLESIIKLVDKNKYIDEDMPCSFMMVVGSNVINNINIFTSKQIKEMFLIVEYYICKGGEEANIMATGFVESFISGYNEKKLTFDLEDILGDKTKDFIEVYFKNKFKTRNRDKYKK